MMVVDVKVTGDLEAAFAKLGGGHAVKLADKTVRIVAYRYRKFIRTNFLSGQMLGEQSGILKQSIVAGRKRGQKLVYLVGSRGVKDTQGAFTAAGVKLANIYEHKGGYVITPKDKKALAMVIIGAGRITFAKSAQGKERPFMSTSAREFDWRTAFARTEEEVIGKEIKRLAKDGTYVPGGLG